MSSAIIAFGALFAYPALLLVARGADPAGRAAIHRGQVAVGRYVTLPALLALFLLGAYLASDRGLWNEIWVTIPVTIWFLLGAIGSGFVLPRERRLAELAAGGGPDYDRALAQVRLATYAGLALVLVAAFFMVTKLGS